MKNIIFINSYNSFFPTYIKLKDRLYKIKPKQELELELDEGEHKIRIYNWLKYYKSKLNVNISNKHLCILRYSYRFSLLKYGLFFLAAFIILHVFLQWNILDVSFLGYLLYGYLLIWIIIEVFVFKNTFFKTKLTYLKKE
jgi:hypothetical protein